jgi:protein-S-isoprenylcysteine O-methyltransferase Ste14
MHLIYHWLFPVVWIGFAAYWFISAKRVKRIKQPEPFLARWTHLVLSSLAYAMTFSDKFGFGPLGWQILPQSSLAFFAGAATTLAGLSFAVWARMILGQNWSGSVALKEGHRLILTGPYRLVRHPIYTGIIIGLAGTALAIGQVRGLVAVILLTATFLWKSRCEERLMLAEFGEEYIRYRREVNALVPFVPRIGGAA